MLVTILSSDKIRGLCGTNNTVRCVVVHHLGVHCVAVGRATDRTAAGITGVLESAQVFGMDRLVALQHPDGFVNLEPLTLPSCVKITDRMKKVVTAGLQ